MQPDQCLEKSSWCFERCKATLLWNCVYCIVINWLPMFLYSSKTLKSRRWTPVARIGVTHTLERNNEKMLSLHFLTVCVSWKSGTSRYMQSYECAPPGHSPHVCYLTKALYIHSELWSQCPESFQSNMTLSELAKGQTWLSVCECFKAVNSPATNLISPTTVQNMEISFWS